MKTTVNDTDELRYWQHKTDVIADKLNIDQVLIWTQCGGYQVFPKKVIKQTENIVYRSGEDGNVS